MFSFFFHVTKHTTFSFFFFNKEKPRLSYLWPDLLVWLMTHVLLSFPFWDHGTCYLLLLLAGLAAPPALCRRGFCQPPRSPHRRGNAPLPQTRQRTLTAHYSSLGFVLLHTSEMTKWGWKGLWQVSSSLSAAPSQGSAIIWEVLIQRALKIPPAVRMLWPSPVSSSCWGRQGGAEGKNKQASPRRGEGDLVLYQSQISGWPQCRSLLCLQFYRRFFLDMMCASYQLLAASAHTYAQIHLRYHQTPTCIYI